MSKATQVREEAVKIISSAPNGIKASNLNNRLKEKFQDLSLDLIWSYIWNIHKKNDQIIKPQRGHFQHTKYINASDADRFPAPSSDASIKAERDEIFYYEPLVKWLKENEECDKAVALGPSVRKQKWGNPDVLGIARSGRIDAIAFPEEVIAFEVKDVADWQSLINAFGQACAYRLFAHRSYIAVPKTPEQEGKEEWDRFKTLCNSIGIGLITFLPSDDPEFKIEIRAVKCEPDMYYTNSFFEDYKDRVKDLF